MSEIDISVIEKMIYVVRGQRVMLDSDLARLYGVETRTLNQAVKRNIDRFPSDFMIEPNSSELASLRSQFVILEGVSTENHNFKFAPRLFTENGVAMLSSVLKSKEAIHINIAIMRTFTKLRSFLFIENSALDRVEKLEKGTHKLFKVVFERLDEIDEKLALTPSLPKDRKKIGLKKEDE